MLFRSQGEVCIAVRPALPVEGVHIILGNGLAGGHVWPDVPPHPVVNPVPVVNSETDESERDFPEVFAACAVARAGARVAREPDRVNVMEEPLVHLSDFPLSLSHAELVTEQQSDPSIKGLLETVIPVAEVKDQAHGYCLDNGLLVRRWVPCGEFGVGNAIVQIVAPAKFRKMVLQMAHDQSGHMGVRKTYDRILRYFFWPRLKKDVSDYIRTCHTCQITGKPNQVIKPAPLHPIPAIGEPFEHIIIDCVGPLPPSRSGASYLLTVMCQATRYPAAYPLRSITTRSVVKALSHFISIFGIPRVVQSDQGSNFSSHMFAQVLKQLRVKHSQSSAYHAQSQGALERFHQTLKSLLRAFCTELDRDWEEGLPWLMLAAREVTQESTGFSPNELVFAHSVRGPLAVLRDGVEASAPPKNLLDYVNGFRHRLYVAGELARKNLATAQEKMKRGYNKHAERRQFSPGDQVMSLLPMVGSPFQAKFTGPHTVVKQTSEVNYIISTPERRKKSQLCHVNLLKPYYSRVVEPGLANGPLSEGVQPVALANTVVASPPQPVAVTEREESVTFDQALLYGRLKNTETLANLDTLLGHLQQSKRVELAESICRFPGLFGDTPSQTHLVEHDIEVGEAKPIRQRFYRVSEDKRRYLDAEIKYMLENGIAEPSFSSWASPCLLVPKSDNTPRFCSDFRKVNSVTKPDAFPLPRMDDCIDQVGSAKFVSKFDLLKGYWQVPLTRRAQEISAFITPSGLYSYKVMPFGLRNAPATFQRLMNRVVGDLAGCAVYLDDVVVYSSNWDSHVQRIQTLFERLASARLTVNLAKCEFARATVTYLGHVVGQGHVRPVQAKVLVVEQFPVPTTKKELMRFLGMVGYYRSFCRNFSSVAASLTDLLRGKVEYVWSPVCQQAFQNVKALLCSAPVLAAPCVEKPFKLQVDASHVGTGAVLMQSDKEGLDRPVRFFSKKFNRHQLNYSVIEKELLALVWALGHFDVYVGSGVPVVVFTDHNPLTFLNSLKCPNQRLIRWSLMLQTYCLDIRHIKGSDNVVADALSRAPVM